MTTLWKAHLVTDMSILNDLWIIKELGDDFAKVICNDKEFSVPRFALPERLREGDVLKPAMQNGDTLKRKEEILKLFKSMSEK